jgi:hypothetical protein
MGISPSDIAVLIIHLKVHHRIRVKFYRHIAAGRGGDGSSRYVGNGPYRYGLKFPPDYDKKNNNAGYYR